MKKLNNYQLILLVLGVVFLLIYSYLALTTSTRFNSPDEAANYFWASRLAAGQELKVGEELNPLIGNSIHLRSDNVNLQGEIVPGGFLGLVLLYGFLAKIFGLWSIKFLTPVVAVLAGWCFYGLVKNIFSEKIALVASVLLLINPAWWYYASRGLLPNVLFCSLLIIGAWWVLGNYELRITNYPSMRGAGELKTLKYFVGGLFVGLALVVRTSEIIWVSGVAAILIIAYWRKVNWFGLIWLVLGAAAVFIPVLFLNRNLYGGYFAFGYSQLGSISASSVAVSRWQEFESLILPFGFHPRAVWFNFWHYYIVMIWWYLIPVAAGFIWFLIKAVRSLVAQRFKGLTSQQFNQWVYLFIFAGVGVWLKIYYGSWVVNDNISGHFTIGVSYLRYWLPAMILDLPLMAWLAVKILDYFKDKLAKVLVAVLMGGIVVCLSANLVLISEEGLIPIGRNLNYYQKINQTALVKLEPGAVIVSDRSDKIFYPEFRVVKFLGDWTVFEKLVKVVSQVPVYYYSHNQLTSENFQRLSDNLAATGLALAPAESLGGQDQIYRLRRRDNK